MRGKIHGTAFILNLYFYLSPPISSFGSCGHHISILFFELSILSCVVVKIAAGSVSSSPSATILRHYKNDTPHSPKYILNDVIFFFITETFMGFLLHISVNDINYVILSYKSLNTQGSL